MKKYILCFLFIFISLSLCAKDNKISIYYNNTLYQTMTLEEFKAVYQGAQEYFNIIQAEQTGNISLYYDDSNITIKWLKEDKIIKEIQLSQNNTFLSKMTNKYKNISMWGFPISLVLLILLL